MADLSLRLGPGRAGCSTVGGELGAERVQGMGRKHTKAHQCKERCYEIHDATCSLLAQR